VWDTISCKLARKIDARQAPTLTFIGDVVLERPDGTDLHSDRVAWLQEKNRARLKPTSTGVPVAITSPGARAVKAEQYSINVGIGIIS